MTRSAARLIFASTALGTALVALAACDAYTPAKSGDVASQLGKPVTASITGPATTDAAVTGQAVQDGTVPAGCAPGTNQATPDGSTSIVPAGCEAAYRKGLADGARAAQGNGTGQGSEASATESLYRQGVRRVSGATIHSPHYRNVARRTLTYGSGASASSHSTAHHASAGAQGHGAGHSASNAYASGDTSTWQGRGPGSGQASGYAGPGSINEGVYVGSRAGSQGQGGSLYGTPYGYGAHPPVQAPAAPGAVVTRRNGEETRYGQAYQYPQGSYTTHGQYGQNGYPGPAPLPSRPAPAAPAPVAHVATGPVGTYATGGYYAPQGQARVCQCQAAGAQQPGSVWASAGRDAGGFLTFAGKPRH
jgi:hypothetical protein